MIKFQTSGVLAALSTGRPRSKTHTARGKLGDGARECSFPFPTGRIEATWRENGIRLSLVAEADRYIQTVSLVLRIRSPRAGKETVIWTEGFDDSLQRRYVAGELTRGVARHGAWALWLGEKGGSEGLMLSQGPPVSSVVRFVAKPRGKTLRIIWDLHRTMKSGERLEVPPIHFSRGSRESAVGDWRRTWGAAGPRALPKNCRIGWIAGDGMIQPENVVAVARRFRESGAKPDWIALSPSYASNVGDWLVPADTVGDKMGSLSRGIQETGMVPGIRLAPFLVSRRSRIGREKRDWLVRNHRGKTLVVPEYPSGREGVYVLDVTHPEAAAYIKKVFSIIRDKWGYRLFFVERVGDAALPGRRRDDRLSGGSLAVKAAHLVRQSSGNRVFLIARGFPLLAAPGEWDAQGVSAANTAKGSKGSLIQSLTRSEWQGRYWHNYLGTVDIGRPLKPREAMEELSRRDAAVINGGLLVITGDPREWDDDALRDWVQLKTRFDEYQNGSLALLPPGDFDDPLVIRNDKGLIGLFNPSRRQRSALLSRDELKRRLGAQGPLKSDGGMILRSPEILVTVPPRGSRLFKA